MWWGGGGTSPPPDEGGGAPPLDEQTSPIPIRGRRSEGDDTSLSSSFNSSFGSPSSDLRDLRNMRHQFNDQEELLGQIREALQTSNQKQQGTEKEDYASRLAQMRQKGKGGERRKASTPIKVEPATSSSDAGSGGKKTRGAKMQVLRKQLEETKARQEAEASSRKDLEDIVSNLQREISKRDGMIASLQLSSVNSSVISSPFVMSPEALSPNYSPGSTTPPHRGQSDYREQLSAKDNKILELSEQVAELGRQVFDLEENIKEKDEIITARTKAVGLAAASASAKGKNTLEQLDDTREQLKLLQETWAGSEASWRREREEKKVETQALDYKLTSVTQERDRLAATQTEMEAQAREHRTEMNQLREEHGELKSKMREERILVEARLEEVEEDQTKLQQDLKQKEEIHQGRVSELETRLREVREGSDGGDRITELEISLAEREEEKGNLQLRILELEETISAEGRMKVQLGEVRESLRRVEDDLETQNRTMAMLESEKLDLMEALGARDDMLTDRVEEVQRLSEQVEEGSRARVALEMRCLELEEMADKWEGVRLESAQQLEQEKEASREALKPLEQLRLDFDRLTREHDKFKQEHAAALEKSKLYDTDLGDKYRTIKELKIEVSSLSSMVSEKNTELAEFFPFIEEKDAIIQQQRLELEETAANIAAKEAELAALNLVVAQSGDAAHLDNLNGQIGSLETQLELAKQNIADNELAIQSLESVKEQYISDLEALNLAKLESERSLGEQLEVQGSQLEDALCEKGGLEQEVLTFQEQIIEINKTHETERSSLKEQINTTIEQHQKELKLKQEETDDIENALSQLREEFSARKSILEKDNEKKMQENEDKSKELEKIQVELQNTKELLGSMEKEFNQKEETINAQSFNLESLRLEMDQQLEALCTEKSEMQNKNDELVSSLQDLTETLAEHERRSKELEEEVSLKNQDLSAVNEDMVGKYKIIEDLQNEVTQLHQEKDSLNSVSSELEACNSTLRTQLTEERANIEKVRQELSSKESAMETMQTVLDVLKSESETGSSEFSALEGRITDLQQNLVTKDQEIEQLKCIQESEENTNSELRAAVSTLEKETADYSGFTDYMNKLKDESKQKTEQISGLETLIQTLRVELGERDASMSVLNEDMTSKYKIIEDLQNEVTELQQQAAVAPHGVVETDGDMVRLQQEQIMMLRSQLRDKAELLEQSASDEKLRSSMEQLQEELDVKVQEVEDVKTLLRRTEVAKTSLETKVGELEQFRLELVKESNQHAQESGEKMRELKLQLENDREELNATAAERTQLRSKLDDTLKSLQSSEAKLQSTEAKYKSLTEQGSPETTELIAERDALKEKNDKLKDMCKKYLAKLKQQEIVLKTSKQQTLENVSEFAQLNADLKDSWSTIASYESDLASNAALLHEKVQTCRELESNLAERDQIVAARDDLIRDLKHKLEAAPEDITVSVPVAEDSAHQQTKKELAVIREKCKKLIVKVKQQDALLKKESAKLQARSESVVSSGADDSALEDRTKELDESLQQNKLLEEQNSKFALQLEDNVKNLEQVSAENLELRLRLTDSVVTSESVDSLKAKVDSLIAEKVSLYDVQINLKEEIASLKQAKSAESARVETLQAEIKKIKERTIIAQLVASPLLQSVAEAEPEADDGWGTPEPGALRVEPGALRAPSSVVLAEDDGLITPEPAAASIAPAVAVGEPPVGQEENESDGWGGFCTEEVEPAARQDEPAEQESGWDDEEGWDDQESGWNEEDGWGGDAVLPDTDQQEQEKSSLEVAGEREADIEDGWGDDAWGGFESNLGAADLAANLRLSVDKDGDEGQSQSGRSSKSPERKPTSDPSPRSLALQCKVAEKEVEFESLEEEFSRLSARFADMQEELIKTQSLKDESEKLLSETLRGKESLEQRLEDLEQRLEDKMAEVNEGADLSQSAQQINNEPDSTATESALNMELEQMRSEVETLNQVALQFTMLQERYRLSGEELATAVGSNGVLETRVGALEQELEEERTRVAVEVKEVRENNARLEAELNQANDQLEETMNAKTDLEESLKHVNERRNSLDARVAELEDSLSSTASENQEFKEKLVGASNSEERIELQDKINRQDEELVSLREKVTEVSQEVKEKEEALTQTLNQLVILGGEQEQLREQLEASRMSDKQLNKQLASAKNAEEQLISQLEAAKTSEEQLTSQLGEARQSEEELYTKLEAAQQTEEQLIAQLEASRQTHEAVKRELSAQESANDAQQLADKLDHLQQERDTVDEERKSLDKEVENLRGLVSEMSAENESLQTNLSRVELDLNTRAARVNQLQEELSRLQEPRALPPQPQPDVTNPVNRPDVARQGNAGGGQQPDIMPGQNQPQMADVIGGGQMADVIGGQLDLVNDNAASWFDNFGDDDQGNEWSDGWAGEGFPEEPQLQLQQLQQQQQLQQLPVQENAQAFQEQLPPQLLAPNEEQLALDNEKQLLRSEVEQLVAQLSQLNSEINRLKQQLSWSEGRFGVLERDKVVLEQEQAQLLADFKNLYEQCTAQGNTISTLEDKSQQVAELEQTIASLRGKIEEQTTKSSQAQATSNSQEENLVQNQLSSFFGGPQESAADPLIPDQTDKFRGLEAEIETKAKEIMQLKAEMEREVETKVREAERLQSELENCATRLAQTEGLVAAQTQSLTQTEQLNSSLNQQLSELDSLMAEKSTLKDQLDLLSASLVQKDEYLDELRTSVQQRDDQIQQLNTDLTNLSSKIEEESRVKHEEVEQESVINQLVAPEALQGQSTSYFAAQDTSAAFKVENVMAPAHELQTAAQFFSEAASSTAAQFFTEAAGSTASGSTAAQFFTEATGSTASGSTAAQFFTEAAAGSTAAQFFSVAAENTSTADFFVEETLTAPHQLQAGSQFFEEAAQAAPADNTAAQFFTEEQPAIQNFFNVTKPEPKIFDPYSEYQGENVAEQLQQTPVGEHQLTAVGEHQFTAVCQQQLMPAEAQQHQQLDEEAYRQEIATYQEAIAAWQVWAEEKGAELATLQEHFNATNTAYNEVVFKLNTMEEEKGQAGRPDDKVNEVLKLTKIKDLELEELRETIDRLESEKQDLVDEMRETKDQMNQLDAASEQVEAYKSLLYQLEDTKASYDKVREDELSARSDLSRLTEELSLLRSNSALEARTLNEALKQKSSENSVMQQQATLNSTKMLELENSLAEERRMQEEAAEEFDSMQQEVLHTRTKVNELSSQLETMRAQCGENEEVAKEVVFLRQQCADNEEGVRELEALRKQCADKEVVVSELEALKQQALDQAVKQSENKIEEMSRGSADHSRTAQLVAEFGGQPEAERTAYLEAELATSQQHLADWVAWSETKTGEYNQLLEAYNQYVEAYNTMSTEYHSLKELAAPEAGQGGLQGQGQAGQPSDLQAGQAGQPSDLQTELHQKDLEIARLQTELATKQTELDYKQKELNTKETELVAKTGQIANMSIRTHLSSLMVHKQEETTHTPEPKVLSLHKTESISHTPEPRTLTLVKTEEVSVAPEVTPTETDWTEGEGWGEEGAAELVSDQVNQLELEISGLRQQIKSLDGGRAEVESELTAAKLKNGKLLVKVKTLTKQVENLKRSGSVGSVGGMSDDLDRALEEEMNKQMDKCKAEVREMKKELDAARAEKVSLEKRLETVEGGNERMVEMKEQQDLEVEYLRSRNKELREQLEGLQWQLAEIEERSREELSNLQVALAAYQASSGASDGNLLQENVKLKTDLASLSNELTIAQQTADALREELSMVGASLKSYQDEAEVWRSQTLEAREEIESLKLHIDELQNEKGGAEEYYEAMLLNETLASEVNSLKLLIHAGQSPQHIQPIQQDQTGEQLRERIRREQQLVLQLEQDLQNRDAALQQAQEELAQLRGAAAHMPQLGQLRSRRDSTDSRLSIDREVFVEQDELVRLRSDLDSSVRENRRLNSRIRSWEVDLNSSLVLDQEGLRAELTRAIKTLQIKDHKCEELTGENLRLLEERDTLQLRLSNMMRQMESAANSRAMTPVPGGNIANIPVFDPTTQIRELHSKLEELRSLNYALDVELQRERDQRENMQTRVMDPRSREADQILAASAAGQNTDSPVKHL